MTWIEIDIQLHRILFWFRVVADGGKQLKTFTSIKELMKSNPFRQWLITKVILLVSSILPILTAAQAVAQNASLQAGYSTYYPSESIQVQFQNGPGNSKDWIGVYPEGVVPGSTLSTCWAYVNDSQSPGLGEKEGTVSLSGGVGYAGNWNVYLLLNDGYDIIASNIFTVIDPSSPVVRPAQLIYPPSQPIQITFTNGLGNPKDWVGIYLLGQTPGEGPTSTLWSYVDGTQAGATEQTAGTCSFDKGLETPGQYVVYLLENDGYNILASNVFTVAQTTSSKPKLLSVQPVNGATGLSPEVFFLYTITNGTSKVASNSVVLTIDGTAVPPTYSKQDELISIRYTNVSLYAPTSSHTATLVFTDDATPAQSYTNETTFQIALYRNIVLPQPIYFENFDNTPEGELPAGWTQKSYSEVPNPDIDFGNLDSAAYAQWTVVNVDRFKGSFVTYSDPSRSAAEQSDYHRVLTPNLLNVVNGQVLTGPLASGRFLFGDSGYRNGASQVLFAYSKDFDLTGKKDVYVSYHSLWEQNQDSIAAVEYSIDQGTNWLPVIYMLERSDVLTTTNETSGQVSVDAVATFNTEYSDVALYLDENGESKGGTYGAFIAAPISQDLAPYISPRIDDDISGSKLVELFRLPAADNQSKVRFRFAHAGSDSWYFGIDDFGLYSIPATPVERPSLSIVKSSQGWVISWPATYTGYKLESASSLPAAAWKEVTGVVNNSIVVTPVGTAFYRLSQ